jgi:hypothetical protein
VDSIVFKEAYFIVGADFYGEIEIDYCVFERLVDRDGLGVV